MGDTPEIERLRTKAAEAEWALKLALTEQKLRKSYNYMGGRCNACGRSGEYLGTSDFGVGGVKICMECIKIVLDESGKL